MDKYGPFENEFRFVFFAPPEKYEATFAFYRDILALPHTGGFGDRPKEMRGVFLQAACATIEIICDPTDSFLRRQIMQPDQTYQPPLGGHLLIEVEDVDSRFDLAQAAGVPIIQPLTNWPWNFRDFEVADPCGNIVCLFSRIKPSGG